MKQYYKTTSEDFPVKTNNPSEPMSLICIKKENEKAKDYKDRSKKEYNKICKERNEEIEKEQELLNEQMQPIIERNKLITQKMREIAEQELIKDNIIQPLEVKK